MISGSPKCPLTGLTGGELGLGINPLTFEKQFTWPICKKLLFLILEDKVSDVFVCELVWERLFYNKEPSINDLSLIHI